MALCSKCCSFLHYHSVSVHWLSCALEEQIRVGLVILMTVSKDFYQLSNSFIHSAIHSFIQQAFAGQSNASVPTLGCNLPALSVLTSIASGTSHPEATAAAKSRQSCPTLCDPRDGSPPGSTIPGILQARTLEWVAISFSNA